MSENDDAPQGHPGGNPSAQPTATWSGGPTHAPAGAPVMTAGPAPAYGPPPPQEPQRPALDRLFDWFRSNGLYRDTGDKWLAGVCSGVARRLGIDPLVIRAALVVLVILGGIGIWLYLLGWLLIPDQEGSLLIESALRDGDVVGILLLAITAITLFGGGGFLFDNDGTLWIIWVGIPIAVVVWWFSRRGRSHEPLTHTTGTTPGVTAAAPAGAPTTQPTTLSKTEEYPMSQTTALPYAAPGTSAIPPGGPGSAYPAPPAHGSPPRPTKAPRPPRPSRRRGLGFAGFVLAIGLAVLAFGSVILLHDGQGWTSDASTLAMSAGLAALGLVILVGGFAGRRAGFTGFVAIIAALVTWLAIALPDLHLTDGAGDRTWRPTTSTTADSYEMGFGSATLDLGGLGTGDRADLTVEVGVGELRIEVPSDLTVHVVGEVGAGEIQVSTDGTGPFAGSSDTQARDGRDERIDQVFGDGEATVTVDASVGLGQLVIVQQH